MSSNGDARLGAGTIFHEADKGDPSWRDGVPAHERIEHERAVKRLVERMTADVGAHDDVGAGEGGDADDAGDPAPLETFSLADFASKPIPQRKWIVEGLIPDRNVTDLSGDGGTGKSLLAMQLAIAMVGDRRWLGQVTITGGVLYVSAEDEPDEIHRRAATVAERERVSLAELDDLRVVDLTYAPSTELVLPDPENRQSVKPTPLSARLEALVATARPKLVILDTRADMFGGNEIDRVQVRTFIRNLQRLCRSYDTAILLLSHPSRAGMTAGDGQSGSTAWGNSVRSRLYIKRPDSDDPDRRELTSEKANYGPLGTSIPLRWRDGVFVVEGPVVGGKVPDREALARHVDERFMQHLADADLRGEYVNGNKAGQNYAPRVFAKLDGSSTDRIAEKHYEKAFWRLKATGQIMLGKTDGPPSRQRDKLVAADPMAPLKSLAEPQGRAE